jgi:glycerol-3-phosphate dehydrogenase
MLAGPQSSFQIVPRKGEYLLLDKVQGELVERVLFPVPSDTRGKGILVSQTYWGNLLIGPTSRPADELITNDQVLGRIIRSAKRLVPSLDVRRTITSYSGLRAKSDGGDFIIESHPADRWLINVAGIDSPGLTSSPAVAVYVEELLQSLLTADQVGPEPPQQPRISLITARPAYQFNPIRPPIIQPKSAGFRGSLTDDSDPARYIVCRCEKITKAELIDGLHRPVAVRPSLTAIKRRTRVGMGQCQGRYCEQRVLEIMRKELGVEHVDGLEPGSSLLPHRRVEPEDRNRLAHLVGEDETDSDETLKPKL